MITTNEWSDLIIRSTNNISTEIATVTIFQTACRRRQAWMAQAASLNSPSAVCRRRLPSPPAVAAKHEWAFTWARAAHLWSVHSHGSALPHGSALTSPSAITFTTKPGPSNQFWKRRMLCTSMCAFVANPTSGLLSEPWKYGSKSTVPKCHKQRPLTPLGWRNTFGLLDTSLIFRAPRFWAERSMRISSDVLRLCTSNCVIPLSTKMTALPFLTFGANSFVRSNNPHSLPTYL